jgi:hypothetical protein
MAVELEIRDGDPWWLSPDIWAVPGDDPEGAPGVPIVDRPCFLHARVRNRGKSSVADATVRFYWANPALGPDRNTATLVGTSFVSLTPGQDADVLCLTPWSPIFVNGGHECLIAEAFEPSADPLPSVPDFNVPTDRHVAQRNISVVIAAQKRLFHMSFEVHNPSRRKRRFTVRAKEGDRGQVERLLPALSPQVKLPKGWGRVTRAGFLRTPCPDEGQIDGAPQQIDGLDASPGQRQGVTLAGRLEGGAALLHVLQEIDGKTVGGLSVLVLAKED